MVEADNGGEVRIDNLLTEILGVMRYCYKSIDGSPAIIAITEWEGEADDPGVKQYIKSLFFDERKRGFLAGFLAGSSNCFNDVILHINVPKDKVLEWVETDAKIGAERAFQVWEKEGK